MCVRRGASDPLWVALRGWSRSPVVIRVHQADWGVIDFVWSNMLVLRCSPRAPEHSDALRCALEFYALVPGIESCETDAGAVIPTRMAVSCRASYPPLTQHTYYRKIDSCTPTLLQIRYWKPKRVGNHKVAAIDCTLWCTGELDVWYTVHATLCKRMAYVILDSFCSSNLYMGRCARDW